MELTIIYEDESVVVLNKPSGMMVHPDGISTNKDVPSVTAWLMARYPGIGSVGGEATLAVGGSVPRSGTVHRIDRETTGVLIVAKTQAAFEFLQKQFIERQVGKTYQAYVYGTLPEREGVIELPIGRSRTNFRKYSSLDDTRGTLREAKTSYKVLASGVDSSASDPSAANVSFVQAEPKTGRTHQIRVHFLALGNPIVGDRLYAPGMPKLLGFERFALHAFSLTITLPTGEKRTFEAPLPPDFVRAGELFEKH